MTRCLYLDCVGGIAGDMLLGALIDAGASLDAVQAGLPIPGLTVRVKRVDRRGVRALSLNVDAGNDDVHRRWSDVRTLVDAATMPDRARSRAHAAFALLAEAEARVHGVAPDEVMFHEVGALDSIADICGVALALEDLHVDEIICSPVPLGRGLVSGAHGLLPLPAPATVELLRGADVCGVAEPGETVTPTGAALVASLASEYGPLPRMKLEVVGTGAGTRDPEHVPNIVRVLIGQRTEAVLSPEEGPLVLETNLDDLLPEFVPDVIEACLAAGAVDVWSTPAGMKHGRPGITLSALVAPTYERAVAETMLRHTTALGLRVRRIEHRWALERKFHAVEVCGHPVNVKLGLMDGEIVNVKPEHRDCVRVARATGQSVKAIWTRALAAYAATG